MVPGYWSLGVVPGYWSLDVVPGYWSLGVVPGYWSLGVVPGYWSLGVVPGYWSFGVVLNCQHDNMTTYAVNTYCTYHLPAHVCIVCRMLQQLASVPPSATPC